MQFLTEGIGKLQNLENLTLKIYKNNLGDNPENSNLLLSHISSLSQLLTIDLVVYLNDLKEN